MRGNDLQKFTMNPVNVNITRSRFDRSCEHLTTFNAGRLIPFFATRFCPVIRSIWKRI